MELSQFVHGRASGRVDIRQIAALPYRIDAGDAGAQVSVLLVTSRETRRWVIPKGNMMAFLAPHAAAAREAEEEAGVRGAISPTSIGSYRYRKRRGGASMMMEVDVFPLAVTKELGSWKEQAERERRWFPLSEAADAVEEPDLAELIRSFAAPEYNEAAERSGTLVTGAERSRVGRITAWFRRLLPAARD
jgi:8-oxo-dGTP pyrophosphatase MutT (NUDIX family)